MRSSNSSFEETLLEKSVDLEATILHIDAKTMMCKGTVKSSAGEHAYMVSANFKEKTFTCTCSAYAHSRHRYCKHIVALMLHVRREMRDRVLKSSP